MVVYLCFHPVCSSLFPSLYKKNNPRLSQGSSRFAYLTINDLVATLVFLIHSYLIVLQLNNSFNLYHKQI